ncbi:MAG: DUF2520 domain-containing protein, partial [Bacteroidales bacterium]|nr:DUF2520 domain-containing protein [Bacteroidales bacterium]
NKEVNFSTIPFCIEANKPEVKEALIALATCLSYDVREISTQARQIIHLAAVFACNFPNYLFVAAADILESREISFDILLPLIWESLNKISDMSPWQAQTGPAIRGDSSVIDRHLQLLAEFPEYKDIYRLMSEEIICRKQKKADN